jgi:hypothetical protein
MRTLIALFAGCLISASAFAAVPDQTWREARIRPQDSRLVDLLRAGAARSATFRAIVNRLEAGNVIVYVSLGPMRSGLAGKLTWMSAAGAYRYLRATISTEQSADQMIATLAHELHHALEVSDDHTVIDQRSLIGLYKRIGRPTLAGVAEGWDTAAAQETGFQVRRELIADAASARDARVSYNTQS